MSGVQTLAELYRIKAAHRRRRRVASGQSVQRYYDPGIGRFLSVDPVVADTKTGWNFNRYNYAANNPYRFTDPDGREIRIIGSDEFVKRIESQIADADAASPKIAEMTAGLRESSNVHEIRDISESPINQLQSHNVATDPSAESNGVGTGTTTYMDSTRTTSGGGVKSSPTENLVHELKHAALKDTGSHPSRDQIDPGTGNPASEQPSLDMQNEYRRGTGETKMREKY